MTKSPIPTPEEALALQNIMPQGPMPTPAGNGYAQWAADPQNSQKIINSLVPPGQSIMPAQPPLPAPMSPANPSPAASPSMGPIAPQPWTPPDQLATAPQGQSAPAPMPTASAIMPPSMQGQAPAQQAPLVPPGAQPPAPNQIPPIQSYKDWSGANPDMLDKASLKGRGPGRIALGSLIAAAQGFSGGLKGNPGAGVEWAQGQMQHDQNLPTINQQRYNAAVVAPAQAALALQDTNSQINQRNAAAAKSTAQAGAIGDDTKGKAKNVAEAAKLGMTPVYDENGNLASFTPDPNSPIAKKQQAALDYTHAQTQATQANEELRKANTELAKAKNNPNSPAYKLALTKAATAQQNANAATTRAQAYMGNYLQMSRGVDLQGNVLPGSTQIANDQGQQQVVGSRNASQAVKEQSNAAQFNDVHGALDNIEATGQALVHAGGSLNSPRIVKALQETKGTGPDYIQSLVKQGLNPAERDYVTSIQAAHENVQALRKSAGGTATDTAVAKLDAMIPGASTPDIDYLKRQTTQIRQTAERLGKGASTAAGGLSVRGQQGSAMANPPNKQPIATHRFNPATMQVEEIKK